MFATNDQEAQAAFDAWLNQGPGAPTNGDLVKHDQVDRELLHHLASFMYHAGKTAGSTLKKAMP